MLPQTQTYRPFPFSRLQRAQRRLGEPLPWLLKRLLEHNDGRNFFHILYVRNYGDGELLAFLFPFTNNYVAFFYFITKHL
jgi:hypothetical protein